MNRDWWASPTEAFIYNEFADALREGFRLGAIDEDDLLTEDLKVLAKLEAAASPLIDRKLARIRHFDPRTSRATPPGSSPRSAGSTRRCGWAQASGGCRSSLPHKPEAPARDDQMLPRWRFGLVEGLEFLALSAFDWIGGQTMAMCFSQFGSGAGKSDREWTPRDSLRSAAAAIISRATISMFCMAQPAGSSKTWGRT